VGITARVLRDMNASRSSEARIVLGAAVVDDVLALVLLGAMTAWVAPGGNGSDAGSAIAGLVMKTVGFLALAVSLGSWLTPACFRQAAKLRTPGARICTLSLSFNNDGPLGTFFRYICDNGTYIARYDDLVTGREEPVDVSRVDVSTNGIELQDREFIAAIREGREPNSSVRDVLPCYRVLSELDGQLAGQR